MRENNGKHWFVWLKMVVVMVGWLLRLVTIHTMGVTLQWLQCYSDNTYSEAGKQGYI